MYKTLMQIFEQLIGSQAGLVAAFVAVAAIVVLSGIKLSVYGDALADRTGLGSGLVGLVFLAGVTSLPEVVVSLTSVIRAVDAPTGADLATGNMLGSNVFNLLILALMALLFPIHFKPREMKNPHNDSTVYGLIMLGIFAVAFATAGFAKMQVPLIGCSWPVLALPIAYGFMLAREHRQHQASEDVHLPEETKLTRQPAASFYSTLLALCGLIIGGGVLLSILGARMSLPPAQGGFGLEASLIGTLFLAISTSLPELVISFASIRLGFLEMAVGNVLGSNMFNLLIIFIADTALRGHSMLRQASAKHWTSVVLIFVLTLSAFALLRTKTRKAATLVSAGMLALYIAAMAVFM